MPHSAPVASKYTPTATITEGKTLSRKWFSDISIAPESWVGGLFGLRGSGKSALAARLAITAHHESGCDRQGEPHRNGTCAGGPVFYFPDAFGLVYGNPASLEELVAGQEQFRGAVLILDELQILVNKFRSASRFNFMMNALLQQVRKLGVTLIYTSNAPRMLDSNVGQQTDAHAYCDLRADARCFMVRTPEGDRAHLLDCRDTVKANWVDTNRQSGFDPSQDDGRRRTRIAYPGMAQIYPLYNTFSVAAADEVLGMTADKVTEARAAQKSGISFPELVGTVRNWVVAAVEAGATHFTTSIAAQELKEQTGMDVSSQRLGQALAQLGIEKTRYGNGSRYRLPEKERLGLWLHGLD